ncbi:multiubiquitin domain-containing protein [Pseudomonas sp. IT-P291]|uniref:multiubiquitin domain-containing protein n=1 Tax=Pseudomonas sp. IT-P291 TaxID=3026448 RepID=UPI0039E09B5A
MKIDDASQLTAADLQPHPMAPQASVQVNGERVRLKDWTPTIRQVLTAAGLQPAADYAVLHWPKYGPTQELGLEEMVDIAGDESIGEFFGIRADGILYFVLNDERYAWAGALTEADIRKVGRLSADDEVWLERRDEPDRQVKANEIVDLTGRGVERFYSKKAAPYVWQLDVQGIMISSHSPVIRVRDALEKAEINPDLGWTIRLKVKGQPKRAVELTDSIDLTTPGIERLKLLPKSINNGEVLQSIRRDFPILAKDEAYLDSLGVPWETIDEGRRWLLINSYPLPSGYDQSSCRLAIEVPQNYPVTEIDMFYCSPPLMLASQRPIPQTEHRELISGCSFQRWSRHRSPGDWSPVRDSILSHMGLVDESVAREVE